MKDWRDVIKERFPDWAPYQPVTALDAYKDVVVIPSELVEFMQEFKRENDLRLHLERCGDEYEAHLQTELVKVYREILYTVAINQPAHYNRALDIAYKPERDAIIDNLLTAEHDVPTASRFQK